MPAGYAKEDAPVYYLRFFRDRETEYEGYMAFGYVPLDTLNRDSILSVHNLTASDVATAKAILGSDNQVPEEKTRSAWKHLCECETAHRVRNSMPTQISSGISPPLGNRLRNGRPVA